MGNSELCCDAPLPTLNGWILGYPVVYYFKKENSSKAVRTLSVSSLIQFKVLIRSSVPFKTFEIQDKEASPILHLLTSFTVPDVLSSDELGDKWIDLMQKKVQSSQLWRSLELQITSQVCPTILL
ncbi:hypothetical protein KP509_1Z012800 [Ceratopteris richardii]|nr:hypothetical protein KP509_1Z012800 [Ceratopteris richardii]KAH6559370.1 hypothetical protein KP509_1Z012800 [Ceratopteris richardii]